MNAVTGAIFENMKQIDIIFEDTANVFTKDTKNTSESREVTVNEFLASFFPTTYRIKKGPIFNIEKTSQEIDCVILAPNHPPLITPKREVIIAEGVHSAVEVKPNIATLTDKSEFHRGLIQIQSVKQLDRELPTLFTEGVVPNELKLIPCIIFAKTSREAKATIEYMKMCVDNGKLLSRELPDLVVTLDHGIIFHSTHIENTLFNEWVKQQSLKHTGEKYIHLEGSKESILGMFLLILMCFKDPEPKLNDYIVKNYIKYGLDEIKYTTIEP